MNDMFMAYMTILESACVNDHKDQIRIYGANFSGFRCREIFFLILNVHIDRYFGNKYKTFLNYRLIHSKVAVRG
jgi:hypothetical protein